MEMAAGGGEDVVVSSSDSIRYIVQHVYRDLIIKHVRCGSIIGRMGVPDEHQRVLDEINALENMHRQSEATAVFLDYLKTNEEHRDYSLFLQLLEEDGYIYVVKLLRGDETLDPDIHKDHCRRMQFYCKDISEKVDFGLLYPRLIEREWMDTEDAQLLRRLADNNGSISATKWLVSVVLPRRKENWFKQFLQLLWDLDYHDLVHHIEENFHSAAQPDLPMHCDTSSHSEEDMDEEDSTSGIYASASGSAYMCDGDFDVPPIPEPVSGVEHLSIGLKGREASQNVIHRRMKHGKLDDRVEEWMSRMPPVENMSDTTSEASSLENNTLQEIEESTITITPGLLKAREEAKNLENRLYQEELVQSAADGSNVIIIAPTGSGKTVVALKIIEDHFLRMEASNKKAKIAFFANEVTLVHQQHESCVAHLDSRLKTMVLVGETKYKTTLSTEELIQQKEVLFMTPQVVVDALASQKLQSLSVFTLIIFDECHHVRDKHPTNQIMCHYMEMRKKSDLNASLPQVVGLTASVGVGNSSDRKRAKEHIMVLCANMDATSGLITVQKNKDSLAQHANNVETAIKLSSERTTDPFKECIEQMMSEIENKMAEYRDHPGLTNIPNIETEMALSLSKGTQRYTQWLGKLYNALFVRIKKDKLRRICLTLVDHLTMYNKALLINADCRACDGMAVLKTRSDILLPHPQARTELDTWLDKIYTDSRPKLLIESKADVNLNPNLLLLRLEILDQIRKKQDSRVLILVATRDLARSLIKWMYDDQQLKTLSPVVVTGCGASSESGGMTRAKQLEAVRSFKWGDSKVAVATSVAEEGMDVATCSLVIRYEYVSNEIGMIQARGRASRVKDGSYKTITSSEALASKEENNKHFEVLMEEVVRELQQEYNDSPGHFRQQLLNLQESHMMTRQIEKAKAEGISCNHGVFQLHCHKCSTWAFSSKQIRVVAGVHRFVLSPHVWSLTNESELTKLESFDGIEKIKTVECKFCKRVWGSAVMYKGTKFLCVSIKSFKFIDVRNSYSYFPKKWVHTRQFFACEPMSENDMIQYRAAQKV